MQSRTPLPVFAYPTSSSKVLVVTNSRLQLCDQIINRQFLTLKQTRKTNVNLPKDIYKGSFAKGVLQKTDKLGATFSNLDLENVNKQK